MSINGIFLVDGFNCVYPYSQIEYGFDKCTWEAMVEECNGLYPVDSLRESTENSITKLSKAIKKDIQQSKAIVNEIAEEEDSIKESLHNVLSLYSPEASKKLDQHENTFSLSAVYPMVLPFLRESHLTTTNGTDGKTMKKESENASKKGCHFSDLSVNFDYGAMPKQALAIVEIKPPHKVRNGSLPDLVKLAYQMKDSIDKMIDDKMDDKDITVLGILVEGFRCTLFVMNLRYQGLYRLAPLSIFFIPRERHDFCVLASSYEALSTMQVSEFSRLRKRKGHIILRARSGNQKKCILRGENAFWGKIHFGCVRGAISKSHYGSQNAF
ncbi:hypothetical protein BJV82DRAFT_620856 [Fennellomyces sp. T-0311]|nr:hypothetical protein BJV82DRAFT_620856 [Fennellomyces sp. T-0311]